MFIVEPYAQAPDWLRRLADRFRPGTDGEPRAVAFVAHHPAGQGLRDREADVTAMLRGLAADLDAPVRVTRTSGRCFGDMGVGFRPVGAQYQNEFKLMVA